VAVFEQRKSRRFDLTLPIELLRSGRQTLLEGGQTKNLSSCGVLFRSTERVDPGDIVEYTIALPTTSADIEVRLRCKGKVIRSLAGLEVAATLERYEFVRQAKPRTV
jgi:hypothetical protein